MNADTPPPDAAKLIEEGRKIVAAMTAEPWHQGPYYKCDIHSQHQRNNGRDCIIRGSRANYTDEVDATGIVWLRNNAAALFTAVESATREAERMRAALRWYGEQSRLARLIHSEGDAGRNAIANDGGKRAIAALAPEPKGQQ